MKNANLVALGSKIRTLRVAKKFSQEEFAYRTGLDTSYISRIERGINNPTYLTLNSISAALGMKTTELIGGISA